MARGHLPYRTTPCLWRSLFRTLLYWATLQRIYVILALKTNSSVSATKNCSDCEEHLCRECDGSKLSNLIILQMCRLSIPKYKYLLRKASTSIRKCLWIITAQNTRYFVEEPAFRKITGNVKTFRHSKMHRRMLKSL